MSRRVVGAAVLAATGAIGAPIAFAYFSATKTSPQPINVAPLASVTITVPADDLIDTSSGNSISTADALSDALALDDNRTFPKDAGFADQNFGKTFATNRYYQFDYGSPLPPGQPASNVTFNFRFRADGGGEIACIYFEVISGGNVIGTHGDKTPGPATSPWCADANTEEALSTPLPEVTSTNVANGLKVKVYGTNSAAHEIRVDVATITGTINGQGFTLAATAATNAADSGKAPQTRPEPLSAPDGTFYTSTNNWTNQFQPARYIEFKFPGAVVPAAATIESVSFLHRYQVSGASTLCYYLDAISGGSSIGTVPSPAPGPSGTGISCATGTATWTDESIPLPMVNTVARANGLVLRLFYRMTAGGGQKSREDYAALKITYY